MIYINSNIESRFTELSDIPHRIGKEVILCGRIYKIREMSGFAFVVLQTRSTLLQCIYSEEFSLFPLNSLKENMFVEIRGTVVAEERSTLGLEVRILSFNLLSSPAHEPPVVINNKEIKCSLNTLLDYRPLTLRNTKERSIFKIQAEICKAIRAFLDKKGFVEIHTPKIVSGSAEGGANVFHLDYFGKNAFLAQSPQFYKQTMVGVFERVYEIAPAFRAEKHDTSRHINEYTSVDIEVGYIENYIELMKIETALLNFTFDHLRENCSDEIKLLGAKLPHIDTIPSISFAEAKETISRIYNRKITDYDDFDPEEEKLLCEIIKKQTGSEFVFVTQYRASKRPFYTMNNKENPFVTDSFDLLFRGLEVTTGGQRIHDYWEQTEKMKTLGMNADDFKSYLMAHEYGLPPHGGMGIGLERLTAKLLGFENVRNATMFPRDINRLQP